MKKKSTKKLMVFLGLLVALMMSLNSYAQNLTITGTVKSFADKSTLPGVTVSVKNGTQRTSTNEQGKYSLINVPTPAVLVFSYLGFITQEITINGKIAIKGMTSADVELVVSSTDLEETIVIGYGTQKKSYFSGASSSIDVEKNKINEIPVESLDKALQGRIAGVQIRDSGGEVGQTPDISIRGVASFSAGTSPLIVIDGLPTAGTLSDVSMNDVATVDILKDAASTAIYGSRGANGVILITTKQGQKNKNQFTVKYTSGLSDVYKYYDTFDNYETFARNEYRKLIAPWESDYIRLGQAVPSGTDASGKAVVSPAGKTYLSWENYFTNKLNPATGTVYDFNGSGYYNINRLNQLVNPLTPQESVTKTGYKNNVSIAARGGSDKTSYYISAGYDKTGGVMIKNDIQAINLTANLKTKIKDNLSIDLNMMPRVKTSQLGANAQLGGALRWLDIPLTYDELTLKTVLSAAEGGYVSPTVQPGDFVKSRDFSRTWLMNDDFSDFVRTPAGAKIRVTSYSQTPGTTSYSDAFETDDKRNEYVFTGNFAVNWSPVKNLTLRSTLGAYVNYNNRDQFVGSFKNSAGVATSGYGKATYSNSLYRNLINENTLTYKKNFGNHYFNVLAGFSDESSKTSGLQLGANFFDNDEIRSVTTAGEITPSAAANSVLEESLLSVYGRVNYDYKGKYLLTLSIRKDGSSKFGPDNRWGTFPMISAAYRLSEEPFLKKSQTISELKFRASYGVTGNNKIVSYAYVTGVNKASYTFDAVVTTGYAANSNTLGNSSIGWEQTNAANFGFTLGLLKNRINIDADFYLNKTKSLLLQRPIINITGHEFEWQNIGQVQNKGVEFQVSTQNIKKRNFTWNTDLNFSVTRNKLLDYGGAEEQFFAGYQNSAYRIKVGSPLGEFYGYQTNGEIWKTTTEIAAAVLAGQAYTGTAPGDVKFSDTNGDGKLTEADKTSLGDVYPKFEFGVGNSLTYKKFDMSFFVQGSFGAKVWNFSNIFGNRYLEWLNVDSFVDEFHGTTPSPTSTTISGTDYFVENASFLALRDVSLGYRLPKQKLRVFFSGRNLLYLMNDKYHGVNPEFMATISGNLIRGEQRVTTTTMLRTYTFGLDFNF